MLPMEKKGFLEKGVGSPNFPREETPVCLHEGQQSLAQHPIPSLWSTPLPLCPERHSDLCWSWCSLLPAILQLLALMTWGVHCHTAEVNCECCQEACAGLCSLALL